jgi:hypothetical protein
VEITQPTAKVGRLRKRELSLGPLELEVIDASTISPNPYAEKQQPPCAAWGLKPTKQVPAPCATWGLKPTKQAPVPRVRGLSLGPLNITATSQQRLQGEGAAQPNLKLINEPLLQRRRGVSLEPLEIHHGVSSKPSAMAAARIKLFPNRLSFV